MRYLCHFDFETEASGVTVHAETAEQAAIRHAERTLWERCEQVAGTVVLVRCLDGIHPPEAAAYAIDCRMVPEITATRAGHTHER